MPLIIAIAIGAIIFFGIKGYVKVKKKSMELEIGEGFCVQCGEKIINKKCPNCDISGESK